MLNNYAIVENSIIINVVLAEKEFAESQGWILLEEGFTIGDLYENGQFIKNLDRIKQKNKNLAQQILLDTDWTATVDISNPQYANPYLTNQQQFLEYRSLIRQIILNPPDTDFQWPIRPKEIWSN